MFQVLLKVSKHMEMSAVLDKYLFFRLFVFHNNYTILLDQSARSRLCKFEVSAYLLEPNFLEPG